LAGFLNAEGLLDSWFRHRTDPISCEEHELKRPTAWPEDLIKWSDVTVAIKALGSCLSKIPKSDNCPNTSLELSKEIIKRRIEYENINPETFYDEEEGLQGLPGEPQDQLLGPTSKTIVGFGSVS